MNMDGQEMGLFMLRGIEDIDEGSGTVDFAIQKAEDDHSARVSLPMSTISGKLGYRRINWRNCCCNAISSSKHLKIGATTSSNEVQYLNLMKAKFSRYPMASCTKESRRNTVS
jgi:hypothetical protein